MTVRVALSTELDSSRPGARHRGWSQVARELQAAAAMAEPCFSSAQQVEYLLLLTLGSARAAKQAEDQAVVLAFFFPLAVPGRIEAALFWRKLTIADLDAAVGAMSTVLACAGDHGASAGCVQGLLEVREGARQLSLAMTHGHLEINGLIASLEKLHQRYRAEREGCALATQPVELSPATVTEPALEVALHGGAPGEPSRRLATPHDEAKRDESTTVTLTPGLGHGGPRIVVRVDTYDVQTWRVSATAEVTGGDLAALAPFTFAWEWDGKVIATGVASTATTSTIAFLVDSSARARRLKVTVQSAGPALERALLVATPLTRTESRALPRGTGLALTPG